MPDQVERLWHSIVEEPLLDAERSFTEKLEVQSQGERLLVLLTAEAVAIYDLFA